MQISKCLEEKDIMVPKNLPEVLCVPTRKKFIEFHYTVNATTGSLTFNLSIWKLRG